MTLNLTEEFTKQIDVETFMGFEGTKDEVLMRLSKQGNESIIGLNGARNDRDAETLRKKATTDMVMDAIRQQIEDLNEQIAEHKRNIEALDDAITKLQNGADPEEIANDPKIMQLIREHEKRTGKKVDPNSPDFIDVLAAIRANQRHQFDTKKDLKDNLSKLKADDPDLKEKIQKNYEAANIEQPEQFTAASNIKDVEVKKAAYEVAGVDKDLIEKGIMMDQAQSANAPAFASGNQPAFMKQTPPSFASAASEIAPAESSMSNTSITKTFQNAANNEQPDLSTNIQVEQQPTVATAPEAFG